MGGAGDFRKEPSCLVYASSKAKVFINLHNVMLIDVNYSIVYNYRGYKKVCEHFKNILASPNDANFEVW